MTFYHELKVSQLTLKHQIQHFQATPLVFPAGVRVCQLGERLPQMRVRTVAKVMKKSCYLHTKLVLRSYALIQLLQLLYNSTCWKGKQEIIMKYTEPIVYKPIW